MSPRRGFTFVELLMAVAVIATLAALSLAALSILRRQSKIATSLDQMTHITTAIDAYIREHRRLGNDVDSKDFLRDPWYFLYKVHVLNKKTPLIDIKIDRLVERTGPGVVKRPTAVKTATHITDHFGSSTPNILSFTIYNATKSTSGNPNFVYANCIILRSSAGTLGDPKDDLYYAYSAAKGGWRNLKYKDLDDFIAEFDPPLVPTYNKDWVDPLSY